MYKEINPLNNKSKDCSFDIIPVFSYENAVITGIVLLKKFNFLRKNNYHFKNVKLIRKEKCPFEL